MAAEFVGGAIVNSIIEVLVDKLASTEMMDYFRTKLDENLLKKLNNSLISINAVVQDAEQQQIRRPTVKEWICNVKDAMMDAEDVLDEIYIQNLKSKLQDIIGNLEYLVNMKNGLLLNDNTAAVGFTPGSQIIPTNLPLEPFIYGRDNEKEFVSDWLKFENDKLSVISLVAMGGMGKGKFYGEVVKMTFLVKSLE